MVDPDAYECLRIVLNNLDNVVLAASDAAGRLDELAEAVRTAAASLDNAMAFPLDPVGDGGPYDAINDAMLAAIYAVLRCALGVIDDAAAGTAASRNALTAANHAMHNQDALKPPFAAYTILRALDVIGAASNNRADRRAIDAARDAFNSSRDVFEDVPKKPPPPQAADVHGRGASDRSTRRAAMDLDDGAEARKQADDPASMETRRQGRGSGGGGQDNEGDHASTGPRPQGRGSELALHGGTCAD